MHPKRIPRERHSQWVSPKLDSESNDVEETSSQSITKISGDHVHKNYKMKHPSSNSSRKKQRVYDIDTDNYSSDIIDRTEVSKKWDTKSESDESASEISSDETVGEKDRAQSERKKSRRNKKSKMKNENISHGSTAKRKSFSKKDVVKKKRKKHDGDDGENSVELPITEILKKAQEQRTKYEEPAPLSELSTNTIYVQGRNGFNAVKIGGGSSKTSRQNYGNSPSTSNSKPIEVAIVFQQVWRSAGFIFQGLLGGMAAFHLIFGSDVSIDAKELRRWQRLTLLKDTLGVLGWVFVSVGSRKDMLLARLHDINKYMHQPVM